MLPRIQLSSKIAARYHVWPFKTLPRLQLKNRFRKNPVKKKKKKKKALQLRKPYRFLFIIFSLSKQKNKQYCDTEKGKGGKKNLAIQWRIVRSIVHPGGIEREAMKSRKRLWRHGERNRKREKRWRHGETNKKRERRSWYTEKEEIASLPTNNASDGFYSFSDFFIGKLDLLYAFNFFNLVLDLDSKIRAKEIRF